MEKGQISATVLSVQRNTSLMMQAVFYHTYKTWQTVTNVNRKRGFQGSIKFFIWCLCGLHKQHINANHSFLYFWCCSIWLLLEHFLQSKRNNKKGIKLCKWGLNINYKSEESKTEMSSINRSALNNQAASVHTSSAPWFIWISIVWSSSASVCVYILHLIMIYGPQVVFLLFFPKKKIKNIKRYVFPAAKIFCSISTTIIIWRD